MLRVAWELEIYERGKVSRVRFDWLSSVVKVRPTSLHQTQTGVPPDRIAYGSMLDLVADLSLQAKTMLEQPRLVGDWRRGSATQAARALPRRTPMTTCHPKWHIGSEANGQIIVRDDCA